jgi:tight adherence protein B
MCIRDRVELRLKTGESATSVFNGFEWEDGVLSQQLRFGIACGIPLSPLVGWLRAEFQFALAQDRKAQVAFRNPQLTSRIVHWLPWVSLAAAQAMGLPAITALIFQPLGWFALAVALVLSACSSRMTRRIIREARKPFPNFGWQYRLLALAVRSGVGIRAAMSHLALVSDTLDPSLEGWVNHSLSSGLPLADLLELEAHVHTNQAEQVRNLRSEELSVKLLLPMALFLLPQFMLLLVVPQVLAAFGIFS